MFLDYYDPQGDYQPLAFFVDITHNCAAIPGDGNTPIVFTHTSDVAKFVVASLELDQWPGESYVIGDKVTLTEFVELAETAKGTIATGELAPFSVFSFILLLLLLTQNSLPLNKYVALQTQNSTSSTMPKRT